VVSSRRRVSSSANLASRSLALAGAKSRVQIVWAWRSRGSDERVGACVRRWMWRCGVDGVVRRMKVDMSVSRAGGVGGCVCEVLVWSLRQGWRVNIRQTPYACLLCPRRRLRLLARRRYPSGCCSPAIGSLGAAVLWSPLSDAPERVPGTVPRV
jgi:hypothetical protein